jgi:serine/threonine protein kinase
VNLAVKRSTYEVFVLKMVDLSKSGVAGDDGDAALEVLLREMEVVRSLHHEHVISCCESYEGVVVFEYMAGGRLFDRLLTKSCFKEREAQHIIRQLVSAVDYCHSQGVVHR